jgi:hypothetical protein
MVSFMKRLISNRRSQRDQRQCETREIMEKRRMN